MGLALLAACTAPQPRPTSSTSSGPSASTSPPPSTAESVAPPPRASGPSGVTASPSGDASPEPETSPSATGRTDAPGEAHVSISYANLRDGTVEVNGFAAGVIEDGGTCTATITSGGETISAASAAFADATVTWCEPVTITAPNARVGDEVELEYSSATTHGRATATIGIP